MNFINIKYICSGLILIGLLFSCQEDEVGFIPNDSETNPIPGLEETIYKSDIYGTITTIDNSPVEGATVTFKGATAVTDGIGVYTFRDVPVSGQHNFVKISKEGFFDNARTFRSGGSSTQYQRTILQEKSFNMSFQSDEIGTLNHERVQLRFDAQCIVIEATGENYSGEVQVAIQQIDPSLDKLDETMPGDLTGRETDNSLVTLQSFGMVNIALQSPDGKTLQVADGKSIAMSYKVNTDLLANAPNAISLWYFDYSLGLWEKEGEAFLSGDTYAGEVTHFSTWNCDLRSPSIILKGKLVNDNIDLSYYKVEIVNSDNIGVGVFTDSEGVFSVRIGVDTELTIKVYPTLFCQRELLSQQLGSFSQSSDLGDVNLDIDEPDFLVASGTAVDCDFKPIEEGRVILSTTVSFPITNAEINIAHIVCETGLTDIRIINMDDLEQTVISDLDTSIDNGLGEVIVCDEIADHIFINNFLSTRVAIVDSVNVSIEEVDYEGKLFGTHNEGEILLELTFSLGVSNIELEEKTYDINNVVYAGRETAPAAGTFSNSSSLGEITIESIKAIGNKSLVTGFYYYNFWGDETDVITGSFKITYTP